MLGKNINNKQREYAAYAVLGLVIICLELVFWRNMIFSPDNVIGDSDSKFVSLVVEHWFKVFQGKLPLRDMPIFYPVPNALGFSDTHFFMALPYAALRALGMTWLSAYQAMIIWIHTFGAVCMAWFLRRNLKLPVWACIIGLLIAYFSRSNFIKLMHVQFITYSLMPLLLIFLFNFFSNFREDLRKKRIIYGVLSILLFSGILFTAFYVGFYATMFLLVLFIFAAVYFLIKKAIRVKEALRVIWSNKYEVLLYIITVIISLLPFIWIYLPVFAQFGDRSDHEIRMYLPQLWHFVNILPEDIPSLFGQYSAFELSVGFAPVTGVLLLVCCVYYVFRKPACDGFANTESNMGLRLGGRNDAFFEIIFTKGFAWTIGLTSLLILNVEIGGQSYSLWWFIVRYVPGASAVRAVCRYLHFLSLPAGIIIALFLSRELVPAFMKRIAQDGKRAVVMQVAACAILVAVIAAESYQPGTNTYLSKSESYAYLEDAPTPPDDCEVFYVVNAEPRLPQVYQTDAMSLAYHYDIKTINGLTGQFPHNWMALGLWWTPLDGDSAGLQQWVDEYGLENVYLYDEGNRVWIKGTS